ncbi:MAG: hypothetical protein ACYST2_01815 [Planctomycetota bacterium]|jgi:hypothetical protein
MESRKTRIFSLLAIFTISLCIGTVCFCAEGKEDQGNQNKRLELTEERIERVMQRIEENDPDKAKELQQLREQDPEEFKKELSTMLQQRRGRSEEGIRRGRGRRDDDADSGDRETEEEESERREERRRYFQRRAEEYLEWLKENYPNEAERLARVKEEKPDTYERNLIFSYRRYEPIMDASEDDPELAEVLKQELQLKIERDRLVLKIRSTDNEQQKEKLAEQLKEVVSERFDLIIKRKEIAYERMLARLERLKKEAEEGKVSLEEFINEKEQNVEERVQRLLSRERRFRWE